MNKTESPDLLDCGSVLFRDEQLLVLDKPSGLLTQPGRGPLLADSLITRVQRTLPEARIVHRLDRDTSGVIVLALDAQTHRSVSEQFAARRVAKRYEAIVAGAPAHAEGTIRLPLRKDFDNPPRHCVDHEHGREAITHYRVLGQSDGFARVGLVPETGRSHQLRVHLARIGHPILGDRLYAPPSVVALASRLQLHACALTLTHPANGARQTFRAACPF